MAQERIDCVDISSVFQLNEAISSLRFYWNLARIKGAKITMELWANKDAILPQIGVTDAKELQEAALP